MGDCTEAAVLLSNIAVNFISDLFIISFSFSHSFFSSLFCSFFLVLSFLLFLLSFLHSRKPVFLALEVGLYKNPGAFNL